MPVLQRFRGLDLPIYSVDEQPVLQTKEEYIKAARTGSTVSFVRLAGINAPPKIDTLTSCLKVADEELHKLADLCESRVIDHEWGLVERAGTELTVPYASETTLLPRGYLLAAKVAIVDGAFPLAESETARKIHMGLTAYRRNATGYMLDDIRIGQWLEGSDRQTNENAAWLVDIEPRVKSVWCTKYEQT